MSDPVNAALFTWGSLWSEQLFSELCDNSVQTHWMTRTRMESKSNQKVKRVDLKQQTVQLVLSPAKGLLVRFQPPRQCQTPGTGKFHGNATEFINWIGTPPTPSRQSRVVSQNVGLVGIRNSITTVQRILSSHNPAVVLLQDCRVQNSARKQVHAQLRQE